MQIKVIMQKEKENTLSDAITSCFDKKPKKVYQMFGNLRENGFKLIEENFIDTKAKLFIAVGIDKKNTTKTMLETMLGYTKDVYFYSNNNIIEFDSNICIFEYAKKAVMYVSSSNISENGIIENISLYTEVIYDLENETDNKEYKAQIKDIVKNVQNSGFIKLNSDEIERLVEEKEIFTTRQYNHNVMSISELLGKDRTAPVEKKEMTKEEIDDVYVGGVEIPKVDLSDINIDSYDIDISEVLDDVIIEETEEKKESIKADNGVEYDESLEEAKKEENEFNDSLNIEHNVVEDTPLKDSELYDESLVDDDVDENATLDIADMLFSKADVKLDITQDESEEDLESKDETLQVKKVNLNNIANLIFELPNKPARGQDVSRIKIPNYIQKMIPEFFELSEKGKNAEIDGISYKSRDIEVEIVDVKNNKKYSDRDAKIMQKVGQTYITYASDILNNIQYVENDIIRIIKLASDVYHLEIIPQDMQEYKLWKKLCTQNFKSSTRKYGMM